MGDREAWMTAREAGWRSGKTNRAPGFLDGRSGSKIAAQEDKKAAGMVKTAAGKEKTRWGALNARSLTSEVRREGGRPGRPPGVSYIQRQRSRMG